MINQGIKPKGDKGMNCTNCGNEMAKGYIYGDRYALKWQAEGKKLFARIWSKGGIRLKKNTIFGRPKTESFVCNTCEVITIDLKTQKAKKQKFISRFH